MLTLMALCHFPNPFFSTSHTFTTKTHLKLQSRHSPLHKTLPTFSCSAQKSSKKPRASRQAKCNEELRAELREFVSAAGLPENHVPTTKQLAENGRKDLANIVRRRGYKVIKELLGDSPKMEEPSGNQGSSDACKDGVAVPERNLIESLESVSLSDGSSFEGTYMIRENGAVATDRSDQNSEPSIEELQLRAANFIQTGGLDMLEDASEVENVNALTDLERESGILTTNSAGAAYITSQLASTVAEGHPDGDADIFGDRLCGENLDQHMVTEMASETDNQAEIDNLKAILHQKEMELSELKQEVEKEKQTLSILQAKANAEIGNAHRGITEKDVELRDTEESLSGLKEVQIEYWGNGETVEVAGSFNGWLHRIEMDLQPSSKMITPTVSRNSKHWSTILWLYPGVYETSRLSNTSAVGFGIPLLKIKFIVDGNWRIDSNLEVITSGNITNNVLKVDR